MHHAAHNGLLIFIMCETYTTPSVVMYSPENITTIGAHNQAHQMFSLSVVFRKKKENPQCWQPGGTGVIQSHEFCIIKNSFVISWVQIQERPGRLFL